jgi:DNA-binding winged helix-turn-helix (wHTH) protein
MSGYRFGPFRLDAARRELARDGVVVELPPKAFDVIVYLLEHRERAVGRDELIAGVWGRVDVSDNVLDQIVLRARKALGDVSEPRRYIATRPRFGFAWVAEVEPVQRAAPGTETEAAIRQAHRERTGSAASSDGEATVPQAHREPVESTVSSNGETAGPQPRHERTERAASSDDEVAVRQAHPERAGGPAPVRQARRGRFGRRRLGFAGALIALTVALAATAWWWSRGVSAPEDGVALEATLVLPFEVAAEADAGWARLGLMDLVAQRLREAGFATLSSESAVALSRGAGLPPDEAGQRALAQRAGAARVVDGRVGFVAGRWQVELRARGPQDAVVETKAEAQQPLDAARAAADQLAAALGQAPSGVALPGGDAALALRLQQIDAAVLGDALDEAQRLLDAVPLAQRSEPAVRLRAASLHFRRGALDEAATAFGALLDDVSASDDPLLRGTVLNALGNLALRRGDPAESERRGDEAIALLSALPPSRELGRAFTGRAIGRSTQEKYDDALADFAQARVVLDGVGDRLGVARVDANVGILDGHRGRFAEAVPVLAAAADRLAAFNDLTNELYARVTLAQVRLGLLEAGAALADERRLAELVAHEPNAERRRYANLTRAEVLAANGRQDEATALLNQVREDAGASADVVLLGWAQGLAARWALAADPVTAAREAQAALNAPWEEESSRMFADTWLTLVRARLAQPDGATALEAARAALDGFEAWAARKRDPAIDVSLWLARAEVAAASGEQSVARPAYEHALAAAEVSRIPADWLMVAESEVPWLLAQGESARAAAVVGRAAGWAEHDFGAALLVARLHSALGNQAAAQTALSQVRRLAGERPVPALPPAPSR